MCVGCIQGWHRSPFTDLGGRGRDADGMTPRMPYGWSQSQTYYVIPQFLPLLASACSSPSYHKHSITCPITKSNTRQATYNVKAYHFQAKYSKSNGLRHDAQWTILYLIAILFSHTPRNNDLPHFKFPYTSVIESVPSLEMTRMIGKKRLQISLIQDSIANIF